MRAIGSYARVIGSRGRFAALPMRIATAGLVLGLVCTAVAAQPSGCPTTTGEDATVVIPEDALAPGIPLAEGDVLRAYGATSGCIGELVWSGSPGAALTLWGDDRATTIREGAAVGEAFELRAVRGGEEVALTVTFEDVLAAPPGTGATYQPDAIYLVSELSAATPLPPGVRVTLTSKEEPLTIPAAGGQFAFTFAATNTTTVPQVVEAWTRAVRPDGSVTRVLLGPVTVVLDPGVTVSRLLEQAVGERVVSGPWAYVGYVGAFSGAASHSSSLEVIKEGLGVWRSQDVSEGWTTAVYGLAYPQAGDAVHAGDAVDADDVWRVEPPGAPATVDLPQAFVLHDPRPNPASSYAGLPYELAGAGRVQLAIYDILGREVAVLVDDDLEPGRYEAVLERGALPSGTYLAQMRVVASDAVVTQTRRLVFVR